MTAQPVRQFAIRRAIGQIAAQLRAPDCAKQAATKFALDRYERCNDSAFRSIRGGETFLLAAIKRA